MTLAEIRDSVRLWLMNRPEATNSLIDAKINQVYLSLAMPFRFHETEASHVIDVVSDQHTYPLATSDLYAIHHGWDSYYGNRLEPGDIEDIQPRLDYDLSGAPLKVIRRGGNVILTPTPDYTETGAITLYGVKLPSKMTLDSDEPVYPEDWHIVIEMQSAAFLAFMLNMDERGQLLQNLALGQLTGRQEPHTIEAFTKMLGIDARRSNRRNRSGDVEIRS